jgi:hypothetical protein
LADQENSWTQSVIKNLQGAEMHAGYSQPGIFASYVPLKNLTSNYLITAY